MLNGSLIDRDAGRALCSKSRVHACVCVGAQDC